MQNKNFKTGAKIDYTLCLVTSFCYYSCW